MSALDDIMSDPDHYRVVRTLRDVSAAFEALEPERASGDDPWRTAAESIDASEANSSDRADPLRTALVAARERLGTRASPGNSTPALDAALAELDRRIGELEASRPLLEQKPAVSGSFRALTDALFVAAGREAPFANRAPAPRSVAQTLEDARADVLALGQAGLGNIRERTSRAMHSMAELVEAVEAQARRGGASPRAGAMRAEAERLEHDSSGPFARTGWVTRGLVAALDALDELDVCRESRVASWTQAARRASLELPERGALPFQHAAMQDAFRSTLDAFGIALLDREACQNSRRRSVDVPVSANELNADH